MESSFLFVVSVCIGVNFSKKKGRKKEKRAIVFRLITKATVILAGTTAGLRWWLCARRVK